MEKITAVGRVTKDVELKTVKIGDQETVVANFNVAVNRRKPTAKRNAEGKREYETSTHYIQVSIWRDLAKALAPHLTKGRLVSIDAKNFELGVYLNANKQSVPFIHVDNPDIELLDGAKKGTEEPPVQAAPAEVPAAAAEDPDELPFA